MCGIVAAVGAVDDAVAEAVRRATLAQRHRGPDDEGFYRAEGVALGHRRLAILDVSSSGHQPMHDEETGTVLIYNGEVYDFRQLRAELTQRGARFRSETDTEVVLQAWRFFGEACVERLRGMFALALWDPERRALFLARDRLGIKPLYHARIERPTGPVVLVASELRALLASGLVAPELEPSAVASYLWQGFVHGPGSLVRGVQLLGAGQRALVSAASPSVCEESYWRLPRGGCTGSSAADEAQLGETLAEAVELRLVSDVPLGVFLSGGIDSSAVSALAMRSAGDAVRTFNVGFDEPEYDETPWARAVAAAIGSRHETVQLTRGDFSAALPAALESLDQPSFDQLNTYFVSRAVRQAGLTVALSGLGGDELFGGYTSFVDLPRAARIARGIPAALRRLVVPLAARIPAVGRGPGPQVRWAKLGDVLATAGELVPLYQVSYALFTRRFHEALLAAPVLLPWGLSPARRALLEETVAGADTLEGISLLELSCFVGERLLRDSDAASMAVSLELRVPLLDHRVVEAAFRLAESRRFAPLGRKRLLRELALGGLDPALFERPKRGFVLPIDIWVRETLRDEVEATLLDPSLCEGTGLDADAVARLWRAYAGGARGIYWSRIWGLFALLWWCRRHGARLA